VRSLALLGISLMIETDVGPVFFLTSRGSHLDDVVAVRAAPQCSLARYLWHVHKSVYPLYGMYCSFIWFHKFLMG
jgi:hypothetical protein